MKVAIFYSEFLQNINQNASIVASFQKFQSYKYPIENVHLHVYNNYFLYKNMFYIKYVNF